MRWIPASEITIEAGKTYHAKLPDAKTIGGTKTIDGTGRFQMSDGTFFWHEQGYVPIGKKEHHLLLILDEQTEDWIAIDGDNYPVDTPIIIEHKYGYDAVRLYNGMWKYCYANEPVKDILLNSILTSARRYLIASTPQGGDNKIK